MILRYRRRIAALSLIYFVLSLCFTQDASAQNSDRSSDSAAFSRVPTVYEDPELVMEYQKSITADDLAAHLYLFASDFFEGRETSTRGQKLAAGYLASQYRKMGIAAKGTAPNSGPRDPAAYFQLVPLYGSKIASSNIVVTSGGSEIGSSTFSSGDIDGHSYLMFGEAPAVSGSVVFGGYGIADDDLGYNDYAALESAGISYTDGWLMILADEPLSGPEKSMLSTEDGAPSRWTTDRFDKLRYMMSSTPKGVLIVGDTSPREKSSVKERAMKAGKGLDGVGSLSLTPPDADGGQRRSFPPMFVISSEFANTILATSGRTVESIQKEINGSLKPVVFVLDDVQISSTIKMDTYEAESENVVAFIEGSDPVLKHEYVVISSHYDHIGMDESAEGDGINNGADDDGSGTVAVLEIAEAFEKARRDGVGPRRSILFLNVTGEEKGLLGSAYYTDTEPIVPLEKTVTNLNIDMIGRIDPTHPGKDDYYVYIIGSNLISQELHDKNQRVNELTKINLDLNERFNSKDDPNQFYRRSDHWNFGKHNIPFIFFFTGTHDDYHSVGDEPDKIEYERLAKITQLIFATAWQVANQDKVPEVSGEGFK